MLRDDLAVRLDDAHPVDRQLLGFGIPAVTLLAVRLGALRLQNLNDLPDGPFCTPVRFDLPDAFVEQPDKRQVGMGLGIDREFVERVRCFGTLCCRRAGNQQAKRYKPDFHLSLLDCY